MVVVNLVDHSQLLSMFNNEWSKTGLRLIEDEATFGATFFRIFPGDYYICCVDVDFSVLSISFTLTFANKQKETAWVLKWL